MKFFFLCIVSFMAYSQSPYLAKNYIEQGAYEKALSIYKKLHKKNPRNIQYIEGLVSVYQQLEAFGKAENMLQQLLQINPKQPQFWVALGHHYEIQTLTDQAQSAYQKAIQVFDPSSLTQTYALAQLFEKYNLLDQAATVYSKSMAQNPNANFSIQLSKIYGEQGKLEQMFESFLSLLLKQPSYYNIVKRNLDSYIDENPENDANQILKKVLIKRIQKQPEVLYNEMLSWLFVQQKAFKKAFQQEKAIYKRKNQSLQAILDLAKIALREKAQSQAEEILNYILEQDTSDAMRLAAHQILLKSSVTQATKATLVPIKKAYQQVINAFANQTVALPIQLDYAHFLAFDCEEKKESIRFLKNTLAEQSLSRFQVARLKLKIADVLVLDQKFNEALIYYSQIQNLVKNNTLAQEARFKVAKTSYYKGDFAWAQTQLQVLKSSTSQLIANDAMQLSLIIRDNSLEDSTQTALKIFAKGDWFAFQKKNQKAIAIYQKILDQHRGEKIEDEALLQQAKLFELEKEFDKAKVNYLKIIEFYKDEILADEAYYRLAELYANKLNLPDKAKACYEKIIFKHADSIYYVAARKKYRKLRGDEIE